MAAVERIVAGFGAALRAQGLSVPAGSLIVYARALSLVGLEKPERVYWAGRSTLVRRADDIAVYDRVFDAYWHGAAGPGAAGVTAPDSIALAFDEEPEGAGEAGDPLAADEIVAVRYSAAEVLGERDLSTLTAAEWSEAQRLISAMRISAELRPSRRTRPDRRRRSRTGDHPDLRGTVRRSMSSGGVPLRRAWRSPVPRPRRMVFLLDVSGSMEPYARGLVRFAHAAVASRRAGRVEVFTIGTRLTRLTRELARHDPDAALAAASATVRDWSGGTRIGDGLQEFNDSWGVRGMARGAVVVICSDGWDRGDPQLVASEMARLSRVAHRVVWVNPLKASPGYAPLARGMAAALPYVDQFVEGHAVASLEHLAGVIAGPRARLREDL